MDSVYPHLSSYIVKRILPLLLCASIGNTAKAQYIPHQFPDVDMPNRFLPLPASRIIYFSDCKNFQTAALFAERAAPAAALPKRTPFIQVHGDITYHFTYRSFVDTPFAQQDLTQHYIQTNLRLVIKNQYPLKLSFTNRSSNSPYFSNVTDLSVQFDRSQLLNQLKAKLLSRVPAMVNMEALNQAENLYRTKFAEVQQLDQWLKSPAQIQQLVEEREKAIQQQAMAKAQTVITDSLPIKGIGNMNDLRKQVNEVSPKNLLTDAKEKVIDLGKEKSTSMADSLATLVKDTALARSEQVADSLADKGSSFAAYYAEQQKKLAQLERTVLQYKTKALTMKKTLADSIASLKREINGLASGAALKRFMHDKGVGKEELTKGQRLLTSISQLGIGRSWVDYSELTVKNISLAGFNAEINPGKWYFAFAAGKVNYRFRDFILRQQGAAPNQSLYLIRAGLGQKERNNLIFTFYNGKKQVLNATLAQPQPQLQRVLGFSAEARLQLNQYNYLLVEVAKSSYPVSSLQTGQPQLLQKALDMRMRSNEAYSIKLYSAYPSTHTKLMAWYRKMGERFESFNLFPLQVNQEAWMVKLNQQFFKQRLTVEAAVRKNDFNSPIAVPDFKSATVFTSIQAMLRIPRWPFVSVGFYPSSQLLLTGNNTLTESQYNTLNIVASHNYLFKRYISMNTNVVYTKFYNSGSDTGFVYYNASSYTLNHSIMLNKCNLQTSIAVTDQQNLHLLTLEQGLGYQIKNWLSVQIGLKWNRLNKMQNLVGGTTGLNLQIKKIGTIQLQYDKTYLPGFNRLLMPVDMGRASFYREF